MSRCYGLPLVVLLGALAVAVAPRAAAPREPDAPGRELLTSTRRVAAADLERLAHWGEVTFRIEGRGRQLGFGELVRWGSYEDSSRTQTLLSDGSIIVGDVLNIEPAAVRVAHSTLGALVIPRSAVRGILLNPPREALARDRMRSGVLAESYPSDRVVLRNGDLLAGSVQGDVDSPEGLFGFETLTVLVQRTQRELAVAAASVELITLQAEQDRPPDSGCRLLLGWDDGTLLVLRDLQSTEQGVTATTVAGFDLEVPAGVLPAGVSFLQPLGCGIPYLTDQPLRGSRQIPFHEAAPPPAVDKNVLGGRLRSGHGIHFKGIGMQPAAQTTFDVPQDARRFDADLSLDAAAGRGGSVVYRVFLPQSNGGWREAFASPVIRGESPPLPIQVELGGARQIVLIVEFADRGDVLDYANWLDARFVMPEAVP